MLAVAMPTPTGLAIEGPTEQSGVLNKRTGRPAGEDDQSAGPPSGPSSKGKERVTDAPPGDSSTFRIANPEQYFDQEIQLGRQYLDLVYLDGSSSDLETLATRYGLPVPPEKMPTYSSLKKFWVREDLKPEETLQYFEPVKAAVADADKNAGMILQETKFWSGPPGSKGPWSGLQGFRHKHVVCVTLHDAPRYLADWPD